MTREWSETGEGDWAWLAGLVDGEGCLTVRKCVARGKPNPSYSVAIRIAMASESAIRKAARLMGAEDRIRSYTRGPIWRRLWEIEIHNADAMAVLWWIRPHLTAKANEADALVKAWEGWTVEYRLSSEQLSWRESAYKTLRALKLPGAVSTS